jgi:branched-chain amino acid transport system permease protein
LSKPALEASRLVKTFGGLVAVDHVDIIVNEGEIHAMIGPNGSGKTSILNLISGIYLPDSGAISLDGCDITRWPRHRRTRFGIGRTFQGIRLFSTMSVFDNVFVAAANGKDNGSAEHTTKRMLELVGMSDRSDAVASSLPYGDQRLVEIARAISLYPKLLLLDEPVAGMAPDEMDRVGVVIRQVAQEGVGVLLVEHEMGFALGISEKITVLNFGAKIAEGVPSVIRTHPEVVRAYLGEEGDLLGTSS